jgi:hypothetical protein
MLNLFQHPFRLPERSIPVEKWTLKQVQGDELQEFPPGVKFKVRYRLAINEKERPA